MKLVCGLLFVTWCARTHAELGEGRASASLLSRRCPGTWHQHGLGPPHSPTGAAGGLSASCLDSAWPRTAWDSESGCFLLALPAAVTRPGLAPGPRWPALQAHFDQGSSCILLGWGQHLSPKPGPWSLLSAPQQGHPQWVKGPGPLPCFLGSPAGDGPQDTRLLTVPSPVCCSWCRNRRG